DGDSPRGGQSRPLDARPGTGQPRLGRLPEAAPQLSALRSEKRSRPEEDQMAAVEEQPAVDADKVMGFVYRAVDEVGATLNTALVVMGDRLAFYHALAGAGPLTPAELAE